MDLNYIQSVMFAMGKFVFLSNFILLLIAVVFERKVSSVVISLLVLALASGIMSALSPVLLEISSGDGLLNKLAWYGGFAFVDCVALYFLFKFHKLLKQNVSSVAHLVGFSFLLFTMLQSIRFIDRYVLETDMLSAVYRNTVPALNLILIPLIMYFWLAELRERKSYLTELTQ
ncbi:hypothetical protein [Rheinheimera baltica]|uniref:hypothetical protein n=1 Tax=Rheinheimera baltica TaxID=67576 RepID=UPI000404F50B|nr:hypothetical protein [Rheinheimera baltica]